MRSSRIQSDTLYRLYISRNKALKYWNGTKFSRDKESALYLTNKMFRTLASKSPSLFTVEHPSVEVFSTSRNLTLVVKDWESVLNALTT